MKRRHFLQATAGGVAAAALSGPFINRAKALPFGEVPADYTGAMLPKANQAQSILEVFMYGGVSPWETFYCSDTFGKNNAAWLYTFLDRTVQASALCGYTDYNANNLLTPFATDSLGKQVFLGPFLQPILARPDVLKRMRIVINRHGLEPHEAAIPLAICGKTLGSPALASLGAHVQRHFVDIETGTRTAPFSYGFATAGGFIPTDNVLALVATGLHPGSARPLLIKVDNVSRLNQLLDRTSVGSSDDRTKYDALMQAYFDQYESQLKFGKQGDPLRATRYRELAQAAKSVSGSQSVKDVLDPSLFVKLPGAACGETNDINVPAMSLRLATHLLTHPVSPAKHCCVVDTGLEEADGGGGYDTHREMTFTQSRNLNNLLTNLLASINKPGENDPNKIDLDKTMVILNQEFGRAPTAQNGGFGRNHWPYGYMQVYIGGPITEAQKGVYGSIEESGQAKVFTTPTENRIAALLAMGIWPFDQAGYSNSEIQNQSEDAAAIVDVTKRVLGYQL
ncbi:MAG: DUF1501 domain-containing protein [Myxococcales bacterium]